MTTDEATAAVEAINEEAVEQEKKNNKRHMIYFVYDDCSFEAFPNKFSADRALQQDATVNRLKYIFRGLMKEITMKRIVKF